MIQKKENSMYLRKNPITKLYVYEFEPYLKININYEESFVTLKNIWLKKITQFYLNDFWRHNENK